ncbi:MPN594 family protein [Mycoplasmoides genitalium]|uniref:MPN594 family protein n=1 Tax=Mycoplasmoides genitalium TaxID=2097 RepID=UPI00027B32A6|nr:hypothetical protein [Mycoplasmoides genitalium]AFQ03239.1 hypothetical protein CM9_02375 [Mycoplasmoides genitalium M2321]AFQ04735.1 hypothetical protein CM5_02335 [Mycoplasmoides genitalium M2288]
MKKKLNSVFWFIFGLILLIGSFVVGFLTLDSSYQANANSNGINFFGFNLVSLPESVVVLFSFLTFLMVAFAFISFFISFFFLIASKTKQNKNN